MRRTVLGMTTPAEEPLNAAEEDPGVPPGAASDGVPTGDDEVRSDEAAAGMEVEQGRPDDPDSPAEVEVGLGPTD